MSNARRFCKIYESKNYGQILARLDSNENDEPCIVLTININDMYISSSISGFDDDITEEKLLELLDEIRGEELEDYAINMNKALNE